MVGDLVLEVTKWLNGKAVRLLLLQCGDVESNPGPRGAGKEKPDKNKIMQEKLDAHEAKFKELEDLISAQKEIIEGLKDQQVQLSKESEENKVQSEQRLVEVKVRGYF